MQINETVHGCPVAVVHPIVRVEILALQVKSGPPRDSRLWLRPAGRAMQREDQTDHGNGPGTDSSESAVNHLSKSVVRESRTPRSVGTGGGRPLPVTRCHDGAAMREKL